MNELVNLGAENGPLPVAWSSGRWHHYFLKGERAAELRKTVPWGEVRMANPRRGDFEDSSYDISEDLTRKSYMHICTGLMNWTPFFRVGQTLPRRVLLVRGTRSGRVPLTTLHKTFSSTRAR